MNKYEKMIQELIDSYNIDETTYKEKAEELYNQANVTCHKYNDQINTINSLRHGLQDEISDLYKFLVRFGNVDKKITPFHYVTEDSKYVDRKPESPSLKNSRYNNTETSGFMKTTAIAMAAFVPVALPALLIGNFWRKRAQSKEMYLLYVEEYEKVKIAWEKSLEIRQTEIQFYKVATEIADKYRALVSTVRNAIRETILPELSGVDAFLVADAIKNSIISGMDPREAEVSSIDTYRGTAYDMHYVFVRNAFDYYTMLVNFFTEPILTKIVEDNEITPDEREMFENERSAIEQQTKLLENTAIFGG